MNAVDGYGRPLWVLGSPISHTLSPALHNAAFEAAQLDHRYFALEVDSGELPAFLDAFRRLDGLGANLTLPLKEAVRDHVENESEAVATVKAANTLHWEDGELRLENTDVYGFKQLVEPWWDRIREERVLLMGAGGAARACLQGLKEIGAEDVSLWNRTTRKAERLSEQFPSLSPEVLTDEELESGPPGVSVVVNATSLGLEEGDPSPFPEDRVTSSMVGVDLIYGRETAFVRAFRENGQEAVGGLRMLIDQAARAWELWVGETPDRDAMEAAVAAERST